MIKYSILAATVSAIALVGCSGSSGPLSGVGVVQEVQQSYRPNSTDDCVCWVRMIQQEGGHEMVLWKCPCSTVHAGDVVSLKVVNPASDSTKLK